MKVIRLQLSPSQKAKLRKGVAVRLASKNRAMEGKGTVMLIHPDKYNALTKAFDTGRGKQFKLDDEEIEVNKNPEMVDDDEVKTEMSGSGLFDDVKKGLKKAGKAIKKAPTFYKENIKDTKAGEMIRQGVKTGSKNAIRAGILALSGTPASPLVPALTMANEKFGDKGIDMAIKAIGLGLSLGGSIGEAMDALDDVEEMLKGAGLRAGGDGLRAGGRIGIKDQLREDVREKVKDLRKEFRPPMRTLPYRGPVVKGRIGRGLSLGSGQEHLGLDAPPQTHYIPQSHQLKKVSMLSGVSR
jgi:hypothetical protein